MIHFETLSHAGVYRGSLSKEGQYGRFAFEADLLFSRRAIGWPGDSRRTHRSVRDDRRRASRRMGRFRLLPAMNLLERNLVYISLDQCRAARSPLGRGDPRGVPGRGSVHIARSFILSAFSSRRQPEDHEAPRSKLRGACSSGPDGPRLGTGDRGGLAQRGICAEGDLHSGGFAQRGICTAGDLRSGPGLLEAFYPAAGGGTALEAAISQWSFAALALSPCIKKFVA